MCCNFIEMTLTYVSLDVVLSILHFIEKGMCIVMHNNISVLHVYHKCEMEIVFGIGYLKHIQVVYIDVSKGLPLFIKNFNYTKCTCGLDELVLDPQLVPHYFNYELIAKT